MVRRKSRGGRAATWTHIRGRWGHRSRAYERRDRGGAIWIDIVDPDPAAQGRRVRMPLPGAPARVRNSEGGIDRALEKLAEEAHDRFLALIEKTCRLPDREPPAGDTFLVVEPPAIEEAPPEVTLRVGFDAWLNLSTGRFPTKNRRWKAVEHAGAVLCRAFPPTTPWSALTATVVRNYRRHLAKEAKAKGGRGLRRAEIVLDAFYSVGAWLRKQELLPPTIGLAPDGWRTELKEEWSAVTGRDPEPARPRHEPEEVRKLFTALDDPRVDPRFVLLFELAAEQRLGQAKRIMRSDLELPRVGADTPEGRFGVVRIRGRGRKLAASIALSAQQRARIDAALSTGYLHELEAARVRGELADYPLFPGGRLKGRVVPVTTDGSLRPMPSERVLYLFRRLETIAGVTAQPGRGWYGVRRAATDLAQDVSPDDRVLNAISGHADSRTRQLIYQERHRQADLVAAAGVREQLRGRATPKPTTRPSADHLRAEIDRLQAMLRQLEGE